MRINRHIAIVYAIWITLAGAAVVALVLGRWSVAFVSLFALVLAVLPATAVQRFNIHLPKSFLLAIVVFVFATLFLGDALKFYDRYWWWDVPLHAASAIGFGVLGFLFTLMLFGGDRYAAPPWALSFLAFSIAMAVGTIWEIFEFFMDQSFGMHMQESGLLDTMWDLILNTIGASIAALAGFLYLKRRQLGGLSGLIAEFVRLNRRWFRKNKNRNNRD